MEVSLGFRSFRKRNSSMFFWTNQGSQVKGSTPSYSSKMVTPWDHCGVRSLECVCWFTCTSQRMCWTFYGKPLIFKKLCGSSNWSAHTRCGINVASSQIFFSSVFSSTRIPSKLPLKVCLDETCQAIQFRSFPFFPWVCCWFVQTEYKKMMQNCWALLVICSIFV